MNTREESTARLLQVFNVTLPLLLEIKDKSQPGEFGTLLCPECGGVLYWSRARYNGHVQVACAKVGCISFRE